MVLCNRRADLRWLSLETVKVAGARLPHILVGTSGWTYASWKGTFYPEGLPSRRYLEFYAREFPTTEVNYSFYHLPRPQTYMNWARQVPGTFIFAVKASRLITHAKRLLSVEEIWRRFVDHALRLGTHLGPILLQFPPSLQRETARLADFLQMAQAGNDNRVQLRLVCEFRHASWFTDEIYQLLQDQKAGLCIADSPTFPRTDVVTADFTYIRFHGRSALFASNYAEAELTREAQMIQKFLRGGLDVYAYFNNDLRGYAVNNARLLRALLER
jgi:uncharacterized protein YecE (DUF72 family)